MSRKQTLVTFDGETHSLAEWSRITGSDIARRVVNGATPENAIREALSNTRRDRLLAKYLSMRWAA